MKRKELTYEDRKRILRQAEAINLLTKLTRLELRPQQLLALERDEYIRLGRYDNAENWIDHAWLLPLWNSIFWPLLDQGFKDYKAAVERVAETGDTSRIHWEIPPEEKEKTNA